MLTEEMVLLVATIVVFFIIMIRLQHQQRSGWSIEQIADDVVNNRYLTLLKALGIGWLVVLLKILF